MEQKKELDKDKIIPERMAALRSLPIEIKQQLTGEEAQAFLMVKSCPMILLKAAKDYIESA